MPIGLLFWILMVLWLIFGFVNWPADPAARRPYVSNVGLVFVLLFLLGWKLFGFVIQG